MMKWKTLFKRMLPFIFLVPFVLGTIGYLKSGEMLTNSFYASFALYFTNPISDTYNLYIEAARWTAPLMTATAILCVLQTAWIALYDRFYLLCRKDSVAVYSDEELRISFDKNTRVIYPGEKFRSYAKSHIILFSSDQRNMQFYEEHKQELEGKHVFIGVRDLELGLMDQEKNASFFDINRSIARLLWKNIAVWKREKEKLDIVIYGNSSLCGAIVSVGLQMNLFSLIQQVNYHVITDDRLFQVRHRDLKLMNADNLQYYAADDFHTWDIISDADIVIIADPLDPARLQTFAAKVRDKNVYYYSPKDGDLASYVSFGFFIPFGRMETVFTDDNIRRKELLKNAMALNEYYADQYGTEKNWKALTGFLKDSNISAADYGEVIASLREKKSDEELAELEHIRWCRFHYLNYYVYGIPENGQRKDGKRRIHKDLIPYDQLNDVEKNKDKEVIRIRLYEESAKD